MRLSTVDPYTLGVIDLRLKQIMNKYNQDFGGLSIILVGDFMQLPPVMGIGISLPNSAMIVAEIQEKNKKEQDIEAIPTKH